ncbi:MAG: Transrane exosortase (Exosortase EpsH) [Dehalococcoidia bacterium]|nr:Transrane exosortase (Exosortase EpsH) [Dehalococcoidia bacterium]
MTYMESMIQKVSNRPNRETRVALWLILTGALSVAFFRPSVAALLQPLLSPGQVIQGHLSPWIALALSSWLLWTRRKELWEQMDRFPGLPYVLAGTGIVAVSWATPEPAPVFLVGLGLFSMIFGRAAYAPMILIGAYLTVLTFPFLISQYAEGPYSAAAALPVSWALNLLAYPIAISGTNFNLPLASGERIWVAVNSACAGPTTMALFLSLFTFMILDRPLPRHWAIVTLLVGLAGTWLQNLIRITLVLLAGYYFGRDGLQTAHEYLSYILFPLWYMGFVLFYLRQIPSVKIQVPSMARTNARIS